MPRYFAEASLLIALLIAGGSEVKARNDMLFKAAVGEVGSDSFAFGIKLWAFTQIQLRPDYQIQVEVVDIGGEPERLKSLRDGGAQFAVLDGEVPTSLAIDLRSLITLKPEKTSAKPLQLIARADVPADVVYRVTKMIFSHAAYPVAEGVVALGDAMKGLSLPVHPGAIRFYDDQSNSYGEMISSTPRDGEHNVALDNARLNSDEILQLRRACRAAATRGEAAHLTGYACSISTSAFTLGNLSNGQGSPMLIADDQKSSRRLESTTSRLQPTM